MRAFEYHAPDSLDEALDLLSEHGDEAKLIAGGSALLIMMKQDLVQPGHLVGLQRIAGLGGIRRVNGDLAIGGLTTHRELETSPLVAEHCPALAETFRKVATIRIRNVATIGGNLVHGDPALDPPVTLLALGARVHLRSPSGERVLPLDDLFVDYYETAVQPDEVLTEVRVPAMPPGSSATFLKFLPRTEDDYGTVTVAVRLTADPSGQRCEDVRIALGAAGSTTLRARAAEDTLRGQPLGDQAFRAAAAAARGETDPISDLRGSADYKRQMAEVFVRRALERASAELTGSVRP
jgi:carbon-monoxide dehydrogenase medium subunit